jgi:membrane protein DedA with SNARE-associated domain
VEDFIIQYLAQYSYVALVLFLLAGGFGAPIPEDIPLLVIGYLCGKGHADLTISISLAMVSVLGGDFILFSLGRKYGHNVGKLPVIGRFLTMDRLSFAEDKLRRHGGKYLFAARFMPGFRAVMFFSAGVLRVPAWKMLTFDGVAALISVPAWILLAWSMADQFDKVKTMAKDVQIAIFVGVALLLLLVLGVKLMMARRRRAALTPPPTP